VKYFDIDETSNLLARSAYRHHQPRRRRWWPWMLLGVLALVVAGVAVARR
jgi:hypothetical protein